MSLEDAKLDVARRPCLEGTALGGNALARVPFTTISQSERPGGRDMLVQVIRFPHRLVRVERIDGAVKFTPVSRCGFRL